MHASFESSRRTTWNCPRHACKFVILDLIIRNNLARTFMISQTAEYALRAVVVLGSRSGRSNDHARHRARFTSSGGLSFQGSSRARKSWTGRGTAWLARRLCALPRTGGTHRFRCRSGRRSFEANSCVPVTIKCPRQPALLTPSSARRSGGNAGKLLQADDDRITSERPEQSTARAAVPVAGRFPYHFRKSFGHAGRAR